MDSDFFDPRDLLSPRKSSAKDKFQYGFPLRGIRQLAERYQIILLFLGAKFDDAFLKDALDLFEEIHWMTGPNALALLFMPPPHASRAVRKTHNRDDTFERARRAAGSEWNAFAAAMTEAAYGICEALNFPAEKLPAIAFIDTARPGKFAVIPLRDVSLHAIFPKLRRLFSNWKSSGAQTFPMEKVNALSRDVHVSQISRKAAGLVDKQTLIGLLIDIVKGALKQHGVPIV